MAIAHAIASGCEGKKLYQDIKQWAVDLAVDPALIDAIHGATEGPPADYVQQQGWVLIAFRNTLWQLLNAPSFEAGVVDTVMRGGDTDTNAAICGALLGAVYGPDAIPAQWVKQVLNCRPRPDIPASTARVECFWPVDALELAEQLIVRKRNGFMVISGASAGCSRGPILLPVFDGQEAASRSAHKLPALSDMTSSGEEGGRLLRGGETSISLGPTS